MQARSLFNRKTKYLSLAVYMNIKYMNTKLIVSELSRPIKYNL